MAIREAMITRTIVSTVAKVLCASRETGETFEQEFTLSKTFPSDDAIAKVLSKIVDDNTVIIKVVEKRESVNLYGMPESVFVENATILKAKEPKTNND